MEENQLSASGGKSLFKISLVHLALILLSSFLASIFSSLLLFSYIVSDSKYIPSASHLETLPPKEKAAILKQNQENIKQLGVDFQKEPQKYIEKYYDGIVKHANWLLFGQSFIWAVCFLLPAYYLLKRKMQINIESFSESMQWQNVYLGILYGLAIFFASYMFLSFAKSIDVPTQANNFQKILFDGLKGNASLLLWGIYAVGLFTGIVEELFFRGYLLRHFWEEGWEKEGLLLTSLLFGMVHFAGEASFLVPTLMVAIGYTLGYLYLKYRTIWIPIVAHSIYNSSGLLFAYFKGSEF
ncbi:MAG: CPBP family intramembrane glutamic endopeptidase [Spirochaetota bacterium]